MELEGDQVGKGDDRNALEYDGRSGGRAGLLLGHQVDGDAVERVLLCGFVPERAGGLDRLCGGVGVGDKQVNVLGGASVAVQEDRDAAQDGRAGDAGGAACDVDEMGILLEHAQGQLLLL